VAGAIGAQAEVAAEGGQLVVGPEVGAGIDDAVAP